MRRGGFGRVSWGIQWAEFEASGEGKGKSCLLGGASGRTGPLSESMGFLQESNKKEHPEKYIVERSNEKAQKSRKNV